jgi:hypothetical protein
MSAWSFTTADIKDAFAEEITERGGQVLDTYDDGERLFTRSLLPHVKEVQPKDRLQGGVALKSTSRGIWVHPYVFRQVCRNGAVMAYTLASEEITDLQLQNPQMAQFTLREAIRSCCREEVFNSSAGHFRTSLNARAPNAQANFELSMLSMLSHFSAMDQDRLVRQIFARFSSNGDPSRFGLINAVTSVARDTSDPEERWRLEELGGGIAAGLTPKRPVSGPTARVSRPRPVPVG